MKPFFALCLAVLLCSTVEAGGFRGNRFNNQRQRDFNAGVRAGLNARGGHCNNGFNNAGQFRGVNNGGSLTVIESRRGLFSRSTRVTTIN